MNQKSETERNLRMDTNSKNLLEQIKKYYESLAAYEKARQELLLRQSRALRPTDKKMQEQLKKMGAERRIRVPIFRFRYF